MVVGNKVGVVVGVVDGTAVGTFDDAKRKSLAESLKKMEST
jgi:hypothetical protein